MAKSGGAVEDTLFVLRHLLQAPEVFAALPAHASVDAALTAQLCDAAHTFAQGVLAPLNASGDHEGCTLREGAVQTPTGFAAAWRQFCDAGWPTLACDAEDGGQALPHTLDALLHEAVYTANPAWGMFFGILHGGYACLRVHANAALKATYLPRIASGTWTVTMALTEAQAGSDLGLVRTAAAPIGPQSFAGSPMDADEAFRIDGTKIFISGGDHDLTPNIVHLVLARLPEAPAGSKGLSLFLVPKWLPDGRRNAAVVDRIENKMGLHGSPTCVLRFDGATGWLVGEPHRGLNAMFVMMNAARISVGLQGVGAAQAALDAAQAYAAERVQLRRPLVDHAPVQRLLAQTRAWTEGGRMLALWTALRLDEAQAHPDAEVQARALAWASLATPVVKALLTEQGFAGVSAALQVFGGQGYMAEWGLEQRLRDARVSMIYEGTNEIQALDLLQRKLAADSGATLRPVLDSLRQGAAPGVCDTEARAAADRLTAALAPLLQTDTTTQALAAPAVLRMVGLVMLAQLWAATDGVAQGQEKQAGETAFLRRKRATAQVFFGQLLPELEAHRIELQALLADPLRHAQAQSASAHA